jgi:hypothetical protein
MSHLYEDNYGFYCTEEEGEEAFYIHIRKMSIQKKCGRCHKKVRLMKHIKICASCTSAMEFGAPTEFPWIEVQK